MIGQVDPKGGIASIMGAKKVAVQKHLCRHGRTFKLQPDFFFRGMRWHRKAFGVPASTAMIVVPAIRAVLGIPGVGQRNGLRGRLVSLLNAHIFPNKAPIRTEIHFASHENASLLVVFNAPFILPVDDGLVSLKTDGQPHIVRHGGVGLAVLRNVLFAFGDGLVHLRVKPALV